MEIGPAKPAIVATSRAAIITDNISRAGSRCNWLFQTMNSNPGNNAAHNHVSNLFVYFRKCDVIFISSCRLFPLSSLREVVIIFAYIVEIFLSSVIKKTIYEQQDLIKRSCIDNLTRDGLFVFSILQSFYFISFSLHRYKNLH